MNREFVIVVYLACAFILGWCVNAIMHDEDTIAYQLLFGHQTEMARK